MKGVAAVLERAQNPHLTSVVVVASLLAELAGADAAGLLGLRVPRSESVVKDVLGYTNEQIAERGQIRYLTFCDAELIYVNVIVR